MGKIVGVMFRVCGSMNVPHTSLHHHLHRGPIDRFLESCTLWREIVSPDYTAETAGRPGLYLPNSWLQCCVGVCVSLKLMQ